MSSEALVKADFRRMINEIISSEPGGEMRLSLLYSILRNMGYHHSEIIDSLVNVGIILDDAVARLEPRPTQLTLDTLLR